MRSDAPLFVILNRKSGRHGDEDVLQTIERKLTSAGRRFSIHEHDAGDDFASRVESVVAQAHAAGGTVVAAGGDGTINSGAAAALRSDCTFAVLPLGINSFSRAHGVPNASTPGTKQGPTSFSAFDAGVS